MFNKLKQFKDMRDKAKQIQGALAEEHVTLERHGISITMNGNMEVETLTLNAELDAATQAKYAKELINDAMKKVQRLMAEKMRSMGNLNIPGLS